MNRFQRIVQGWKNYINHDSVGLATAMNRAKICAECKDEKGDPVAVPCMITQVLPDEIKEIEGLKCKICNCPLSAKTRSEEEKCPLKKW